jgi:kynureninase
MTSRALNFDDVQAKDISDPLGSFRGRFHLPEGLSYFDGHSLGALPLQASPAIQDVVQQQWGERLIRSWNEAGWIDAPQRIGAKIAPIIGAEPDEVIVADSTSVNLFKLVVAAAKLSDRPTILTEAGNFHTDLYIAAAAANLLGLRFESVERSAIPRRIDSDTNLVLLTHVHFRNSERFDMHELTSSARKAGAKVIWDLSHSAGAVPLRLAEEGVELAVGCGYKYLNGGPGAPSFLYVARHLQERLSSPLPGWMGHSAPFDFLDEYEPATGVSRFLAGTPPILSMAGLEAGVETFAGCDMDQIWAKSAALFELFASLAEERCPELECITPSGASQRGSHIAFRHPSAGQLCQALIEVGTIGDFRAPDVIRFGLTPLYLRFADVWHAVEQCASILHTERWREDRFQVRAKVT